MAARACVPSRAEPVSSRTDSGSAPAAMWAAAVSISARVLPVPGPPNTRTTPRIPDSVNAVEWGHSPASGGPHPAEAGGAVRTCGHDTTGVRQVLAHRRRWQHRRRGPTAFLNVHRFGPEQPAQILAVHGLTGHGLRWRTLATQHLPGFSILAPDLLGHGRSSWEAPWTLDVQRRRTRRVARRRDHRPVVVVGHSFGCAVALKLAVARPDLVASLVLLDPAVGLDGAWMANIADDMMASPFYLDRDEARNEKASARGPTWIRRTGRRTRRASGRAAGRPVRMADQHSRDDVVLE